MRPPRAVSPPVMPSALQRPAKRTCQPGHGTNRNQNPQSLCPGRVSPSSISQLPPVLPQPRPEPPGCPSALASRASPSPRLPSLRAGKRGRRLAPSQAPPAVQPRPHAKADPQFAWHSPAVPRGSLAEMRRALVAVLGGKVPALEPRSSDVKELQPCSALP